MALPVQNTPVYSLTIPSSGKELKFRPFLVKEEKSLLLAQQSEEIRVMVDTLKGVIQSCAKSPIDVDALATFDLEYVFTQIRARSVGEVVEILVRCDTCESDDAKVKLNIDLTKIKVDIPENHNSKIGLFDDVGIKMKYPSLDVVNKIENISTEDAQAVFDIIVECIDYIYDSEQIYHAKEQSKEELSQFLENLTQDQFKKVQAFFETMPKLTQKIEYTCPTCSKKHEKVLEGLANFF